MPELDAAPASVEMDGVGYTLVRQTTGGDYLYVRTESHTTDTEGRPDINPEKYEQANLLVRLRRDGKRLTQEEILALPRTHYQSLTSLAIHFDNEESSVARDFLSTHLRPYLASRSPSETPSASPPPGPEGSSGSEKGSGGQRKRGPRRK